MAARGCEAYARRAPQYPSPLQYRMPVARVYEPRGARHGKERSGGRGG